MKIYRASDLFLGANTTGSLFCSFPSIEEREEKLLSMMRNSVSCELGIYFLPTSKFSGLGSFGQFWLGGSGVISEAA